MIRLLGYSNFEMGDSLAAKIQMDKFFQKAPKQNYFGLIIITKVKYQVNSETTP